MLGVNPRWTAGDDGFGQSAVDGVARAAGRCITHRTYARGVVAVGDMDIIIVWEAAACAERSSNGRSCKSPGLIDVKVAERLDAC